LTTGSAGTQIRSAAITGSAGHDRATAQIAQIGIVRNDAIKSERAVQNGGSARGLSPGVGHPL
jgi:hypothetical protein